jgi:hypothetical protein
MSSDMWRAHRWVWRALAPSRCPTILSTRSPRSSQLLVQTPASVHESSQLLRARSHPTLKGLPAAPNETPTPLIELPAAPNEAPPTLRRQPAALSEATPPSLSCQLLPTSPSPLPKSCQLPRATTDAAYGAAGNDNSAQRRTTPAPKSVVSPQSASRPRDTVQRRCLM